ncbi:MAG: hypothetical protein JW825_01425 [Candidatus Methanofastidiosa archaeon]|nr:hypothetical protein [Candidatus Methanofastidiosa archaeon]
MAAWLTIGKYNMRLNLGKFYRRRKVFVPIVALTYLIYAILLKMLVDANPENLIVRLLSDKALFATLLDLVMLYIFIYLIMIHVFTGIRRQNKSSLELLLSSPVSSSDIVLGETIASLPIYLMIIPILLIPLLILGYFQAGIGMIGLVKIILSQLLLLVLAIGTGAIALTLIQSSIQRTKTSRYFRLLASILSAGLYLSIYFLNSWLSTAESVTQNPFFDILPTSLAGNIAFSEISGYVPEPSIMLSYMTIIIWIAVVYGLGIRIAGKAYSLEKELSSARQSITKEGAFYKILRIVTPRTYTEKVATHTKVYFRDSNNSATSIYLFIIAYFIPALMAWSTKSEGQEAIGPIYLVGTFMIPMFVSISMLSMFYLSRDALWIWKKAPGGTDSFINSKWLQSYLMSMLFLPVPVISGVILGVENLGIPRIAFTVVLLLFVNAFSVSFSMFLNILSPTKSIQGAKTGLNSLISTMGIFFILLVITIPLISRINFYVFVVLFGVLLNVLGYVMIRASRVRIVNAMDI